MRIKIILLITIVFSVVSLFLLSSSKEENHSKSVILIIGDGMGLPIISAYEYYKSEYQKNGFSNFEKFDGSFLVRTRSQDYVITDSAAAATAFATGKKVPNYQVGIIENGKRVPTIMDIAKEEGKSTGIVVECSLTHATPAAFYAFSKSRKDDQFIAQQLIYSNIDVAIGGGLKYFEPLLSNLQKQNYTIIKSEDELYQAIINKKNYEKLIAFTAPIHPPKYKERKIKLDRKVEYALKILEKNKNGFFLMVEASQIDWFAHDNKLMDEIDEMEDLDRLLSFIFNYKNSKKGNDILVLLLSDHDCGGLTLVDYKAPYFTPEFKVNYSTTYHTAEHIVGFYSYNSLLKIKPIIDNTEIFQILCNYVKR